MLYTLDTAPSPAPTPIQLVQPEQPVQEVQVEQPIIEEPVIELQQEQPSLELKIEEPVIELEIEQHRVELQIEEAAPVISFEIPVAEVQSIESVEMPTVPPVIGGFLVKPTQIYAEEVPQQESARAVPVSEPVQELPEPATQELNLVQPEVNLEFQETSEETFELVYHDAPAVEEPVIQIATPVETIEEVAEVQIDEAEAQRARAAERTDGDRLNLGHTISGQTEVRHLWAQPSRPGKPHRGPLHALKRRQTDAKQLRIPDKRCPRHHLGGGNVGAHGTFDVRTAVGSARAY